MAFFRGVANPIGIKVGSDLTPEGLVSLCRHLNPQKEEGKIVLISRFGSAIDLLATSALIKAVHPSKLGFRPVWLVDPMHGNTRVTQSGLKTRDFSAIAAEIETMQSLHKHLGSHLAGVHLEMTGDPVTECTGGISGLRDADLHTAYQSQCDPRLNYSQSLEIAFRCVAIFSERKLTNTASQALPGEQNVSSDT